MLTSPLLIQGWRWIPFKFWCRMTTYRRWTRTMLKKQTNSTSITVRWIWVHRLPTTPRSRTLETMFHRLLVRLFFLLSLPPHVTCHIVQIIILELLVWRGTVKSCIYNLYFSYCNFDGLSSAHAHQKNKYIPPSRPLPDLGRPGHSFVSGVLYDFASALRYWGNDVSGLLMGMKQLIMRLTSFHTDKF